MNKGVLRPSKGKWTSPVFFVPKRGDQKMRLVVNYKQLNDNTKKVNFPIPHINELLDAFGNGCMVYLVMDCASGYWQVPMEEESIERTGFICKHGTYEWLTMPFDLATACDTYQYMMTTLLSPYIGKFVFCFIDDVIVFSRSIEEHMEHLKIIFEVCKSANLRLKKAKCQFMKKKVEYLGHMVSRDGVLPNERNIKKIQEMKTPTNTAEVQSLLGTTNYYRRYVEKYSEIMEPILSLLKKKKNFSWGEEQDKPLSLIKTLLTNPPILAYPDKSQVQILTTDASGVALGSILSQSEDGSQENEKVIG